MAAGAAEGIGVWNIDEGQATTITTDVFTPAVTQSGLPLALIYNCVICLCVCVWMFVLYVLNLKKIVHLKNV